MPEVIGRTVHADRPLTNIAVEAFNSQGDGLIGDMIAPAVRVRKSSDTYYVIDKGAFFRLEDTGAKRAPGTRARRKLWSVSSDQYSVINYALAAEIPVEYLEDADEAIQHREHTTRNIVNDLKLQQEKRIAKLVTSISNVGSGVTLTGGNKWSDFVNSNPLAAVNTAQAFIRNNTGLLATDMALDYDTEKLLRQHPQIIDRFKYTSGGEVSRAQLAEFFGVQRVHVASPVENTGAEGLADSMAGIWPNFCGIFHRGQAVGLMSQVPVMRFQWQTSAFQSNFAVSRKLENDAGDKHVEVIEAGHYQDEKVTARDLFYTILGTL